MFVGFRGYRTAAANAANTHVTWKDATWKRHAGRIMRAVHNMAPPRRFLHGTNLPTDTKKQEGYSLSNRYGQHPGLSPCSYELKALCGRNGGSKQENLTTE